MPEELHVVKCFSCETFQVQIVKKVNKFDCKMCGEKQSVKKEYGRGTGKDCRLHVQKLNELRIQKEYKIKHDSDSYELSELVENKVESGLLNTGHEPKLQNSKWIEFLSQERCQIEEEPSDELANFTFEQPKKRKGFSNCSRTKKCKSSKQTKNDDITKTENINQDSFNKDVNNDFSTTKKLVTNIIHESDFNTNSSSTSKKSKWDNFVAIENLSETNELYSQSSSKNILPIIKLNIFKTDDDDLGDILNF